MSEKTFDRARREFEIFYRAWFETPGISRENAVAIAFSAATAIDPVWELDLSDEQDEEAEGWLESLLHVPELEKEWFGLAEYREAHRVKVNHEEHPR